jgi:hypothetical protein
MLFQEPATVTRSKVTPVRFIKVLTRTQYLKVMHGTLCCWCSFLCYKVNYVKTLEWKYIVGEGCKTHGWLELVAWSTTRNLIMMHLLQRKPSASFHKAPTLYVPHHCQVMKRPCACYIITASYAASSGPKLESERIKRISKERESSRRKSLAVYESKLSQPLFLLQPH